MKKLFSFFLISIVSTLTLVIIFSTISCSPAGDLQVNAFKKSQPESDISLYQKTQPTAPDTDASIHAKSEPNTVKIKQVFEQFNELKGHNVVLEGKIVNECGSGCWFILDDGTGTIYVDLAPSNLVIPQKRGSFARVTGTVTQKGTSTYIIGTKVEF